MTSTYQKNRRRSGPDPLRVEMAVPEQMLVSMAEIAGAAREGLLALAVGTGLQVLTAMFDEDVARLCGPNIPGLVTSPARSQASGSRQTTSPHSWWRPTGVPAAGVPLPATKGNSPQSWVVVAWNSGTTETCTARPPSRTGQPQAGASGAGSPAGEGR